VDEVTTTIDDIDIRFRGAPVFNYEDEVIGIFSGYSLPYSKFGTMINSSYIVT